MSHTNNWNVDDLVSRSTLMPTAGEFIPRAMRYDAYDTAAAGQAQNSRQFFGNRGKRNIPHDSRSWRDNNRDVRWNDNRSTNGFQSQRKEESSFSARNRNKRDENYDECSNEMRLNRDFRNLRIPFHQRKKETEANLNQMEVLIAQLTRGTLECLVCCDFVKQTHPTWSCHVCHHVLHLRCVVKWARASGANEGWRCPACQHVSSITPSDYRCFCGQTIEPTWNRSDCPHSCGEICGKPRPWPCPHPCTIPCHPGPCPPCRLHVSRDCGCGRSSKTTLCSEADPILCGSPCGRTLGCGIHKCMTPCHIGDCEPCAEIVAQTCFCGTNDREVLCTEETSGLTTYSCNEICKKKLKCNNHECSLTCHGGECPSCPLLPEAVYVCPCGKSRLQDLAVNPRKSCLDVIPTCKNICQKLLLCGEPGARHECQSECHNESCPACPKKTAIRCRCGHLNKTILCSELLNMADDARCERKCNKRRSCGKHKCREACCIDVEHICPLPCTRILSCGIHRCEEQCHSAYCRPCPRDSFEELLCECGAEAIFPPVACGTRRPKCDRPCSRTHSCEHPPTHTCHSEQNCPPCTVLVAKRCHGGHELRKAVFCHLDGFSCGLACGKPISCGRHSCTLPCHAGICLRDGQICTQPCNVSRPGCGHACGAPCHEGPCPDNPCKEMVKVTCECGVRYSTRACIDNAKDYQRIATAQLASKMADLAAGQTVDLNEVSTSSKKISYKTLDCTEECKVIERNRRLAVGLQIRNPDLSAKLTPKYSDLLRTWAKKDPNFCQMVHDKLTDLVQLAKQSKQKSRSYSFDSMNWEKRQFIHEYCTHFGCEAVAYDQEPNRNVVATALRDKSWLPGLSLLEVIRRENGARKVPLPSNAKSRLIPTLRPMEVLPVKLQSTSAWAQPQASTPSTSSVINQPAATSPQIDYFDMAPL